MINSGLFEAILFVSAPNRGSKRTSHHKPIRQSCKGDQWTQASSAARSKRVAHTHTAFAISQIRVRKPVRGQTIDTGRWASVDCKSVFAGHSGAYVRMRNRDIQGYCTCHVRRDGRLQSHLLELQKTGRRRNMVEQLWHTARQHVRGRRGEAQILKVRIESTVLHSKSKIKEASHSDSRLDEAVLLVFYECIHLNRNFISTLTHAATEFTETPIKPLTDHSPNTSKQSERTLSTSSDIVKNPTDNQPNGNMSSNNGNENQTMQLNTTQAPTNEFENSLSVICNLLQPRLGHRGTESGKLVLLLKDLPIDNFFFPGHPSKQFARCFSANMFGHVTRNPHRAQQHLRHNQAVHDHNRVHKRRPIRQLSTTRPKHGVQCVSVPSCKYRQNIEP